QPLFQIGGEPTALPVDFPSQVAVSADGDTLWILGGDALARADLRPYGAIQPMPGGEVRWPLALLGALLLALAAAIAVRPTVPRLRVAVPRWPPAVDVSATNVTPAVGPRAVLRLPALPAPMALFGG